MKKAPMNEQFFREFKADPEGTFQRFGVQADQQFLQEAKRQESFEDFKNFMQKSRFFSFFDFNA